MIHIVIGTKGQIIKMYPIIHLLEQEHIAYNYIDTGQHEKLTGDIRTHLGMREPDYVITQSNSNISETGSGLIWMFKVVWHTLCHHRSLFKHDKKGLCLVHGDTVSTLLGAIMAKIGGQRLVHVEAGFRSPKLFKPFPEEIVRRVVDRWSDINFVFKDDGYETLLREKVKGKLHHVNENTAIDAVEIAKQRGGSGDYSSGFALISIHRLETIVSRSRMCFVVEAVDKIAQTQQVIWGLHEPTKKALEKFGLLASLEKNSKILIRDIFQYFDFIHAIYKADFLMTDGGGPQDETKYLGTPCLLIREENEKPGYPNVFDCGFDLDKLDLFLNSVEQYRKSDDQKAASPSRKIVDILKTYLPQAMD